MTFDNSKKIINLRLQQIGLTILILAYIILAFPAAIIKFPVFGLSETVLTIILVGIWVLFTFAPALMNYQYISFSDENETVTVRYFNAGVFGGKKSSIEIPKLSFAGYKTEKGFLVQKLILFQRLGEGVAKYPPVYINALSTEQKQKLFASLNAISG